VTALGQISVRLLTSLEPEHVMRTLGLELKKLGLTCFVALLDRDTKTPAIEYLAIDSRALDVAEKLAGLTVRGFRMPYQRVSSFVEVLEQRRVVFITDVMDIGQTLLPSLPKPIFARVLRLAGATARSHAIYLPLAVEERVLGLLGIWGEGLEESDIAAAS